MGRLVVIEGLDGSGKATQTALLAQKLAQTKRKFRTVSFPDYESDSSALVKMYLRGAFGGKPNDVNAYAASAFYAVDRYASWKQSWCDFLAEGGFVLADRYTTSNAVHQCCKLQPEERENFLAWLEDFEYGKLGIPRPDLVIYLDVLPQVSQNLLHERASGKDGIAGKDIHETDLLYQTHCREVALWCAKRLGWKKVNCTENGHMRPPHEIAQEVAKIVETELARNT